MQCLAVPDKFQNIFKIVSQHAYWHRKQNKQRVLTAVYRQNISSVTNCAWGNKMITWWKIIQEGIENINKYVKREHPVT